MADPEVLFTAYHHRLFRYFCRAVGHPETARDLTQDVFVRVSRAAVPSADEGGVRAWLFRIARNLALDPHRSQARHPEPGRLEDGGARAAPQDVGLAVNEALASLPDLDRDVFLMREVAGLGLKNVEMRHLSMGMMGDFEVAIEEGATMVRLGTAIFGARPKPL